MDDPSSEKSHRILLAAALEWHGRIELIDHRAGVDILRVVKDLRSGALLYYFAQMNDGYLVRKDLVRKFARQYPVPTYVCEFLLGRYCASTVEAEIEEGLQIVERQLRDRAVRGGEEELFKARTRETGSIKIIDALVKKYLSQLAPVLVWASSPLAEALKAFFDSSEIATDYDELRLMNNLIQLKVAALMQPFFKPHWKDTLKQAVQEAAPQLRKP